jgi:tetratricopeptide (TPR) repeat protein
MADSSLDPSSAGRRHGRTHGPILIVVTLAFLCAGCGRPKEFPEGVPGKGPKEIAAQSAAAGHYRRGVELFEAGRYRKAIGSFRASLRANPGDPEPYLEIGASYSRLGDTTRELAAYDEALAVAPEFVPALNSRGVALLKLARANEPDRIKEAVAAFEKALKLDVDYAPAHVNIAIAYSRLGQHELALLSLANAEQFGAPAFDVAANRGLVLAELGRYGEAADAFARALEERPTNAGVRFERAMALAKDDRLQEAILELERVTTVEPEFARAYLAKARLVSGTERLDYSLDQYAEYLARVPKDAEVWNEKGNVHFACGQYEQAEACFRKAISYRRDSYNAYRNLAATLEQLGRQREAESVLRTAERYKPEQEIE